MSIGPKDRFGEVYGRLTALAPCEEKAGNVYKWLFVCECGTFKKINPRLVVTGSTKSCGCLNREKTLERSTKHGYASREKQSPEWKAWASMKHRCSKYATEKDIKNYFERGISVCEQWVDSFEIFLNDMGQMPDDKEKWTVGRIDNNRGYSKDNCRWETLKDQARNRRKPSNNVSGTMGVYLTVRRGIEHYVADIIYGKNKRKSKMFSCKKYGKDGAYKLACAARQEFIKELESIGEFYGKTHGA